MMTHPQNANAQTTQSGQSLHFVQRVLDALDTDYVYLAHKLGVNPMDISAMMKGHRRSLAAVDQDQIFVLIADYVDAHIAGLLSVREELQRKLANDRRARQTQRDRIANR